MSTARRPQKLATAIAVGVVALTGLGVGLADAAQDIDRVESAVPATSSLGDLVTHDRPETVLGSVVAR